MPAPTLEQIMKAVRECLSIIAPAAGNDTDLTATFVHVKKVHDANPGSPDLISEFILCLKSRFKGVPFSLSPSQLLSLAPAAMDTVRKIAERIRQKVPKGFAIGGGAAGK